MGVLKDFTKTCGMLTCKYKLTAFTLCKNSEFLMALAKLVSFTLGLPNFLDINCKKRIIKAELKFPSNIKTKKLLFFKLTEGCQ